MFRTVSAALRIALRIASSMLVWLLPTISLNRYTWSLTAAPDWAGGPTGAPWHEQRRRAPIGAAASEPLRSRRRDSTPEPPDYKSGALPVAPRRRDGRTTSQRRG